MGGDIRLGERMKPAQGFAAGIVVFAQRNPLAVVVMVFGQQFAGRFFKQGGKKGMSIVRKLLQKPAPARIEYIGDAAAVDSQIADVFQLGKQILAAPVTPTEKAKNQSGAAGFLQEKPRCARRCAPGWGKGPILQAI